MSRILWGRRTSINVQKVAWVLAESRIEYENIEVGGAYKGLDTAEYLAMNPNQRVPTLVDGDLTLWESNAICRYLVDAYGGPLAADTAGVRAQGDMWMEWFQNNVYASFIGMFYQTVRLPEARRDADTLSGAIAKIDETYAIAEAALGGRRYLVGDELSLADVPFGASLFRYFTVDIPRPDLPNTRAYYERLCDRPAYREAVMVDYSSLRPSS